MLSDVIMPGLDGPAWVREAQKARPDAKVIFMSGYAEDAFVGGDGGIPERRLPAQALHPQRADPAREGPARGLSRRYAASESLDRSGASHCWRHVLRPEISVPVPLG